MKIKDKLIILSDSFKILLAHKFYLLLAIFISVFLFFFFLFIINIPLFLTAIKFFGTSTIFKVFANIMNQIVLNSGHFALIMFAAVNALAGVSLSLLILKIRLVKASAGGSPLISFGGVLGGGLAAGCPSCSISLLSVLGVSGGLAILPFSGVEFSIIGIAALLISIYYIGKSLRTCKECQVVLKRK